MIAKSVAALSISVISMSTAHATVWSGADVDKALATIADQESGARECAAGAGTKIGHEVIQKDIDGDGVPELEVRSFPEELNNGSSGCYSPVGQAITLLRSDGAGGWITELGFDAMELKYHSRPRGGWPDVELIGGSAGMSGIIGCGPIWRFHKGRYGPWKVCDDNGRQKFADVAPWMKAGDAVRPDSGEESPPVEVAASVPKRVDVRDLRGPEFDHNGSVMIVDHTRGLIIYKEPKKSITNAVKPGDVLFKASRGINTNWNAQ